MDKKLITLIGILIGVFWCGMTRGEEAAAAEKCPWQVAESLDIDRVRPGFPSVFRS
ncbi:MAG: hypothetical protein R6U98_21200 [Pirellulaceae bacterium]